MEDALNPPESWFSIPEAAEYLAQLPQFEVDFRNFR